MDITSTPHDQLMVISIDGSIDSLSAEDLTRAFMTQLQAGHVRLIADFGKVSYTSSAGLRSLLSAVKDSRRQGGDLRIAAMQPEVERVLSLSGFTNIIKTFPSVDLAVASFAA